MSGLAVLIVMSFAAFFVWWVIGADSIPPAIGPVASGVRSIGVLRGALIGGVFGFLGAAVQGGRVAKTIGSGLLAGRAYPTTVAAVVLAVACILVAIGVFLHIPIPLVFASVGGLLGAGLGFGAVWNVGRVYTLLAVWILTPFAGLSLGYVFTKGTRRFLGGKKRKLMEALLFLMGMFAAYTCGANHVGIAAGLLSGCVDLPLRLLLITGGATILLGVWLGGPRIVNAVSKEYSEMGVRRSTCALAATSIISYSATLLGIPVPFTVLVIFPIIGSGLAVGKRKIQRGKIERTILAWCLVLFGSMGMGWLVGSLM
ncbi:hypothetical protein AKJ65_06240 [candidate division MSBL1 archaeon SCGC-AAA259E19]|uniref:Phosphate permease n=1 Tax=candidate division MSBL1 archaeon SCGC-AAA259E19 TaxID=1698264 RepID=A0A133UHF7_9EURY|nr:hypothetical protein AKJ65_06240 [candidate division MSBL1 archaeon SCGC-AAA259E19]